MFLASYSNTRAFRTIRERRGRQKRQENQRRKGERPSRRSDLVIGLRAWVLPEWGSRPSGLSAERSTRRVEAGTSARRQSSSRLDSQVTFNMLEHPLPTLNLRRTAPALHVLSNDTNESDAIGGVLRSADSCCHEVILCAHTGLRV